MKADRRTLSLKRWFRPPRQVLVTFLAVAVLSTAALAYLTWLVVSQERQLDVDRQRTALEQAADAGIGGLQQRLAELIALASQSGADVSIPTNVVHAVITPNSTIIRGSGPLPYLPEVPMREWLPESTFAAAERAELTEGDLQRARALYSALARTPTAHVRAGALVRLARVQRQLKEMDAALATYTQLEALGDTVDAVGYPASLAAALGRTTALKDAGRPSAVRESAERLLADLVRGRWTLTRTEFEVHRAYAEEAGTGGAAPPRDSLAAAESLDRLWSDRHTLTASSQQLVRTAVGPTLVVSQRNGDRWTAVVGGPAYVEGLCPAEGGGVRCVITDVDGAPISGTLTEANARVETRTLTGLPWTVHFQAAATHAGHTALNRRTLTSMFLALAIVLALGWYFILRSITGEIRASRMQTDFISAVSHEFRTPLTSLAHISQMLADDRVTSESLRKAAYGTLVRETDRLRRLVESLLEFGRFEASGVHLRLEPTEAAALVRDVVSEYQDPVRGSSRAIRLTVDPGSTTLRADREALARVVWNLLDNAVKYSPDSADVEVTVARSHGEVAIAVRDHGIGIPPHEQREIFRRFVRGAESKTRHIKGTGIGLALVDQIVRGHGGSIELQSAVGEGSTFSVVLPAPDDAQSVTPAPVRVTAS